MQVIHTQIQASNYACTTYVLFKIRFNSDYFSSAIRLSLIRQFKPIRALENLLRAKGLRPCIPWSEIHPSLRNLCPIQSPTI